jgi:hypothetical protein
MRQNLRPELSSCSLSPTNFIERIAWLRELSSRALISHSIGRNQAELNYKINARKDTEEFIRRESTCCSFFTFSISEVNNLILLAISWPSEKQDSAINLFSNFLPNHNE